jgi:hypothetical protein
MKNLVWIFCVEIAFGCVNDQNGFSYVDFKLEFIYFFATNLIPIFNHFILCCNIKFNTIVYGSLKKTYFFTKLKRKDW